ncbi:MAG: acyltransferase family protein [Prevotella sp.]|nr:acyltransferase family protein [Prevotella sp.]
MKSDRIHYIDIFKGLLIILVVVHHAPLVCQKFGNPYMDTYWANNIIIAFFMPAWFIATGYCTNFNKPFSQYLWQNFKGIMIPCFTLYCINHVLLCINTYLYGDPSWMTLSHWLNPGIRTFLRSGGFYWFLSALFISKLIFWFVAKLPKDIYQAAVCVLMLIAGLYLYHTETVPNIFFFQHALVLTLFLLAGQMLKIYEKHILSYSIFIATAFFMTVLPMSYQNIPIPTVTRDITTTLQTAPLFVLLSILGSLTTWVISRRITANRLLEYMGRGSLVMYAFNYATLTLVANTLVYALAPEGALLSIMCFILTIVISLAVLMLFYWLLNKKWIRIIIGKF